jgi:hemoglobin
MQTNKRVDQVIHMEMSTSLLHYGANERKHVMLEKLGGKKILAEATDEFYNRQINDERLQKFFHGIELAILKWHQFNLMSIAFTEVPDNFDVKHLILVRHKHLFDKGLDETYYDCVMEHFSGTLEDLNVAPDLIEEACKVVFPLRAVFEQGAVEAKERKKGQRRQDILTKSTIVLVGILTLAAFQIAKKQKK